MANRRNRGEAGPVGFWHDGVEFIAVGHDALDGFRRRERADRGPGRAHVPASPTAPFPVYFNFLHGVELALKSYLLHAEVVQVDGLKRDFGHGLHSLMEAALEHDLHARCPSLEDAHIDVVMFSSSAYVTKQFEYRRTGGVQLAPIDTVAEAAVALIVDLGALFVAPGRLRRLARDLCWLNRALADRPAER